MGSALIRDRDLPATTDSGGEAPRGLDPEAWVDRHGDALYRYARLRLKDRDVAAELVQETFLQALRGRDAFAGGSPERTWLVGILRHKILDHYRRASRERGRTLTEADAPNWEGTLFDRRGHWRAGPRRWSEAPGAELDRAEFWSTLGGCLDRLPPKLAEVFSLSALEGREGTEVCEVLGISPANLWTRLHRARMLLRGCLERNWFGEPATNVGERR